MCPTNINLGLMINTGMLFASSSRLIFGGPVITLGWVNWEEFVHCQVRVNETYLENMRQFRVRNMDVLMNAHYPH